MYQPFKKERHRQRKFSNEEPYFRTCDEEPYARASDEDLIRICLSGGAPVLRQSVSVPDQSKNLTTPPLIARKLPTKTTNLQDPQLIRSFSASYNTTPSLAPLTSDGSQVDLGINIPSNGVGLVPTQPDIDIYPIYSGIEKKDLLLTPVELDSTASGVFTFKPVKGRFTANKDHPRKMGSYCKIKIGHHGGKTPVAKHEGSSTAWSSAIALERRHAEQFAKIKVKDHDKLAFYDSIGEAKIMLGEIAYRGKVSRWFPIYKKSHVAGQILLDVSFEPRSTTTYI